jgi:hypothetical protein
MKKAVFLLTILLFTELSWSQETPAVETDTIRKNALNVFMSASNFIRKEITFVNYVRDIKEADVYIISTYERTGSGGYFDKFFLVGQNRCAGMNDTLEVIEAMDETEDEYRTKTVQALKMGLMRYVLKTPLAQYFNINFTQPVKETIQSDKWNSWVFRTSVSGNLNGEKRYKSTYAYGSTSVNRITEGSKLLTSLYFNWTQQKYELNDSTFEKSTTRSKGSSILYVKSINDHWSAGISTNISASSYGSYDLQYTLMPAIEYDIFPYSESTRRQLRILYKAGYTYNDYSDTTIYNKVKEHLGSHSLSASLETVQKWGSADVSLIWKNYFHDWSRNNFSAEFYVSLRIVKGLQLSFMGEASIVNDQLSLPKGGVSDTDILLRRKITETKFSYYGYFGLSYTFGSIYNNVVNPRFGN